MDNYYRKCVNSNSKCVEPCVKVCPSTERDRQEDELNPKNVGHLRLRVTSSDVHLVLDDLQKKSKTFRFGKTINESDNLSIFDINILYIKCILLYNTINWP